MSDALPEYQAGWGVLIWVRQISYIFVDWERGPTISSPLFFGPFHLKKILKKNKKKFVIY